MDILRTIATPEREIVVKNEIAQGEGQEPKIYTFVYRTEAISEAEFQRMELVAESTTLEFLESETLLKHFLSLSNKIEAIKFDNDEWVEFHTLPIKSKMVYMRLFVAKTKILLEETRKK